MCLMVKYEFDSNLHNSSYCSGVDGVLGCFFSILLWSNALQTPHPESRNGMLLNQSKDKEEEQTICYLKESITKAKEEEAARNKKKYVSWPMRDIKETQFCTSSLRYTTRDRTGTSAFATKNGATGLLVLHNIVCIRLKVDHHTVHSHFTYKYLHGRPYSVLR